MLVAVARERLSLPPTPPLSQRHPGELSHQVVLRRERVAEGHRDPLDLVADEFEVVGDQALVRDVVLVDPPVALAAREDAEGLTGREPLELRDHDLDDEAPAGLEMRRHVAEARDLRLLGRQVHDRVEDHVGEGERAVHLRRGEVADRHADVLAARLRAQLRDHRLRQIDPVNLDAPLRERERDPAGPDPELERASAPGELGEEVDDRFEDFGIEQL